MLMDDPTARKGRAQAKRNALLGWLVEEQWITPELAAQVLGVSRSAAYPPLQALERDGAVIKDRLALPGRYQTIYGLTTQGALLAEAPEAKIYERGRIAPTTAEHQLGCKSARAQAEAAGWEGWRGERDLATEGVGELYGKRPDAEAQDPDGRLWAIEVERRIKTPKRYAAIIAAYLQAIRSGRWVGVQYLTEPGMADRLEGLFTRIEWVPVAGQRVDLEDKHRNRFRFQELAEWPA